MWWTPLFHAREWTVLSTRLHALTSGKSPFHGFSTFHGPVREKILGHWKDRLNISKLAQFVSDTSQANEDIVLQSGKNLQTFLWWGWGGGQVCAPPPTIQLSLKFGDFWGAMSLFVVNKSLSNVTILLNALFPAESTDFLWLIRKKVGKKKKTWRGLFELPGTLALVNLVSGSIRPLWFLVRPGTDAARRFHLLLHHRSQYFHFGTSISDVCG